MKKGDVVRLKENRGKSIQGCEGIYLLTEDKPTNWTRVSGLSYDIRRGLVRSKGMWTLRCEGYYVVTPLERLALVSND